MEVRSQSGAITFQLSGLERAHVSKAQLEGREDSVQQSRLLMASHRRPSETDVMELHRQAIIFQLCQRQGHRSKNRKPYNKQLSRDTAHAAAASIL